MKKFFQTIRKNKLYTALLIFIIGVNVLILFEKKPKELSVEQKISEAHSEKAKKSLFDEEDIKLRQEKLQSLAVDNPILYLFLGILNLIMLFLIFVGFVLDFYLIEHWIKKKPIRLLAVQTLSPEWHISDVFRVILIFVAFAYVVMILQSFTAHVFPLIDNNNFRMVFNTAVMNIVGISVILYFVLKKYKQDMSAIGFCLKKFFRNVFYGAAGYVALLPVLLLILLVTFFVTKFLGYKPPVQPIVRLFIEEKNTGVLWFSALFAAVFGPFAEEIFFRGFMYPAARKKIGVFWAVISTSILFSVLHAHIVGFFPIIALSLLLTYLYERTGSLVSSITVHITHNVTMVFLVFLVRYIG
ncbi:MAG: type II CAAX endopeptidase family protein [Candidatus Omnitrophota bacterium]